MAEQIVAKSNRAAQVAPHARALKSCYREAAAWNIYEIVKPDGGLRWTELSEGQKDCYRALVDRAVEATDKIAQAFAAVEGKA